MLLIIAHHRDAEAQWLYDTIKRDYGLPVTLLLPEALGLDYDISLHLQNDGKHWFNICFYDQGIQLKSIDVTYAINRLSYVDPPVWQQAAPVEKTYAASEINAFFPALICSLACPVSNPIHHGSLYGEVDFPHKWVNHLRKQRIPVHPLALDKTGKLFETLNNASPANLRRILYLNNELILPHDQKVIENYAAISKSILNYGGSETLEFIFLTTADEGLQLLHITKVPALSCFGTQYIDAVIHLTNHTRNDLIDGHTKRNPVATIG